MNMITFAPYSTSDSKLPDNWQLITPEVPTLDTPLTPLSSAHIKSIKEQLQHDELLLLQLVPGPLDFDVEKVEFMAERLLASEAPFAYASAEKMQQGRLMKIPTIACQTGSIRDDFNFGPAVLIKTYYLEKYLKSSSPDFQYAGWYDFRLFMMRQGLPLQIQEYIFRWKDDDERKSGQKQFDYVDPGKRNYQLEMEQAATRHLEAIGAKVKPPFEKVKLKEQHFVTEASVIIPVLNRELTIADAIDSVLRQKTNFTFNLIVVNNHSTDRTGELIEGFNDERIIHHFPVSRELGIGGCWNEGIHHPACGRFAIQLDSDDLYLDENTLQKIVDQFYEEECAMVIGSYQMVDFELHEIPPGIIDHREWTDENGPNNALRINGLGAPRAFFTPLIRQIGFPNVSYGEDYAVGLAISGRYRVGRIYTPVYLCRRWNNNTDANLSIEKVNAHNHYKDTLRSKEIARRIAFPA
ncbi:glycosyltransferase family 2 protein [Roseimarinus sediminis]|uniref:glycosyltransferase family 2 protein n=1 Tax=Roseimarinus sediminis TaxID=1610899 RepID=UPI003D1FBD33